MTMDWSVTLIFAGDIDEPAQNQLDDILETKFASYEASTARIPSRGQFTVSGWVPIRGEIDPFTVRMEKLVSEIGVLADLVGVEVLTETELEARNDTPNYPELVSAVEAAELLGVSRQRVHQLAAEHPDFPAPLYHLGAGRLWTLSAMRGFARHWDRRPGPRRRQPAGV